MIDFIIDVLLFIIGLVSGTVIAAGLYAFLIIIGTITRLVSKIETAKFINKYEDVILRREFSMSNKSVKKIVNEKDKNIRKELYNKYVKDITPKHNCIFNLLKAFLIGGLISLLGQILLNIYLSLGAKYLLYQGQ